MSNTEATDTEDWVAKTLPVPSHWSLVNFEEVFQPISTSKIKTAEAQYKDRGAFPIVDQGQDFIGGYTDAEDRVINRNGAVIVFGDHTRCFKLITFPFAPGADGTKVLEPRVEIVPKFAYYGCLTLRLPDRGYSRHYSFLRRSQFPIAPLAEQRRIVAKIEELFSELDKGIEALTTAREQLKAYRQSVLKHAFEGKLTEDWRNASPIRQDLLASIQAERRARYASGRKPPHVEPDQHDPLLDPQVPSTWEKEYLGNLNVNVFDGPFGSHLKTSDYVEKGVRVVRLENIGYGHFIDEKQSFVSEAKYEEIKKHTVVPGDIVFSSFVTDAIRSALVPSQIPFAVNKADCFAIRFYGKTVNQKFVQFFLNSRNAFKQVESMIHGVGRPRINTSQLKETVVPICSREEQDLIVKQIESAFSEIDALDGSIDGDLLRLTSLRQSILKEAFSGQLVAQCSNDEPASVLLERIRAERGAVTTKTQHKTKRAKNGKKRDRPA